MILEFERAGLTVLERGWLSSNNILFAGDAGSAAVIVDTGYWSHAAQTVALVRRALGDRRLGHIVNTHLHSDHCGGNAALQQAYGCTIDVPAGEAAKVDRWDEDALSFRATGQHCPRFSRHGSIAPGEEIALGRSRWHAVASPGHDAESVVLYQPELELLISADALWENGFGIVFSEFEGADGFGAVQATLDRLAALRVRWVIPGHGRPFQDFAGALERAQRRLDGMLAEPARHARHAAKALIVFRLLAQPAQSLDVLAAWLDSAGCIREAHRRYGTPQSYREWWSGLVGELQAGGALRVRDGIVEKT